MSFLAGFIHRQFIYEPPVPTASFEGRTVIITGSSSGIGLEASRWVARLGASRVILACRNMAKAEAAAKNIQSTTPYATGTIQVWHLDLSSYSSVLSFCNRVKSEIPRLDVLIANAGVGTTKFRETEDNEETITTNVVSLFLLAFSLFPKLRATAKEHNTQTHFTVTASELYEVAKFKEEKAAPPGKLFETLSDKSKANMRDRYNVSKLMEIMVAKEMAARYPLATNGVVVNSVAPGLCDSELHRDVTDTSRVARVALKAIARTSEVGARTLVHGASAGPETHGQYVPDCKITKTVGLCKGQAGADLQNRVWVELCEKLEGIQPGTTSFGN